MSNRVAVFHEGIVQQLDTPDAMYERPMNSFVANFIGENNALPGQVESQTATGAEPYCRVRLDTGELVQALPVNVGEDGRTLVSIRPERFRLGAGAAPGMNRLTASMVETIYFGDHVRLHVLAGDTPLMLKLPLEEAVNLPQGAEIALACAPEHCRALDPLQPDA
jgi:putative spermidine/putrescine transport system ATP-binding protein